MSCRIIHNEHHHAGEMNGRPGRVPRRPEYNTGGNMVELGKADSSVHKLWKPRVFQSGRNLFEPSQF